MPIIRGRGHRNERWQYPSPDGVAGPQDFLRRGGRRRVEEPPEAALRPDGELRERQERIRRFTAAGRERRDRHAEAQELRRMEGQRIWQQYYDEHVEWYRIRDEMLYQQYQQHWHGTWTTTAINVPAITYQQPTWTTTGATISAYGITANNITIRQPAPMTEEQVQQQREYELRNGYRRPVTEEDRNYLERIREEQEQRLRERREAAAERERIRAASEERAWALLRRLAAETQGVTLVERDEDEKGFGYLAVVGSDGRNYRVTFNGYQGNVQLFSKDGNTMLKTMCAHMSWRDHEGREIPEPDHWVSQMLDLVCDAPAFVAVANTNWRSDRYDELIREYDEQPEPEPTERVQPRDARGRFARVFAA